jgi:hypothetical protein
VTGSTNWTARALKRTGFGGWVTFEELAKLLATVPQTGGVYIVVQAAKSQPRFLRSNPGGRFKGQDPTVAADALKANWVEGAEVVYVGKANNLRQRLRQFVRFGEGKPIGHWGGRLIWQLGGSAELLVAWRETPGQVPKEVETQMLAEFRKANGKPPFANDPQRLGS